MDATHDIGSLIIRDDSIREGRPRIAGTGITVRRIVGWYQLGHSPEEIIREIPHITLAQVFAALSYYHANRTEIDADIASDEELAQKIEGQQVRPTG